MQTVFCTVLQLTFCNHIWWQFQATRESQYLWKASSLSPIRSNSRTNIEPLLSAWLCSWWHRLNGWSDNFYLLDYVPDDIDLMADRTIFTCMPRTQQSILLPTDIIVKVSDADFDTFGYPGQEYAAFFIGYIVHCSAKISVTRHLWNNSMENQQSASFPMLFWMTFSSTSSHRWYYYHGQRLLDDPRKCARTAWRHGISVHRGAVAHWFCFLTVNYSPTIITHALWNT